MSITATAAGALLAMTMQQQVSADDMAQATATFTSACVKYVGQSEAIAGCSCGTGVTAERMTDLEYMVMASLSPYVGNQQAMTEAVQQMAAAGLPLEVIQSAAVKTQNAAPRIERVCSVLTRPTGQWQMVGNSHNDEGTVVETVSLPAHETRLGDAFRTVGEAVHGPADELNPR